MRVVGLDLGSRRVGVAVSDPGGVLASPSRVIERRRPRSDDHAALAAVVAELGGERVVVGLPLSLDGGAGPAARRVLDEVEALRSVLGVPVDTYDERLSTVSAARALRAGGIKARAQRGVVDQAAAAVILQGWLDGPGRRVAPR